jgi:hypothetical protein
MRADKGRSLPVTITLWRLFDEEKFLEKIYRAM